MKITISFKREHNIKNQAASRSNLTTLNGGMSDHDPTIYTFILTTICVLLFALLFMQLIISIWNKNKIFSWFTCFHVLCLIWTLLRSAYWIRIQARNEMPYLELYLLYWFPTPIQFANFSLLILFYIQVLTGKKWQEKWRPICLPLYLIMTMSMATFTVVWALNSSNDLVNAVEFGDEYDEEFYKVMGVRVQLEYSAFSFFLLGILFGIFGWKLANVESWKQRRLLISRPRVSTYAFNVVDIACSKQLYFQSLAVINGFLFFIFFTRAIRDLATSQNWLLGIWNQLDIYGRVTTFAYFIFFCVWEFLPTVLLLCLITTKAGGVGANRRYSANAKKLPDFGIFHIIISGTDKNEGKWMASPLPISYGATMISPPTRRQTMQPRPLSSFHPFLQ